MDGDIVSINKMIIPIGIYLFKDISRNTKTMCEICSKFVINIPEGRPSVFIVNIEHISHIVLVVPILTFKE